jgi:carboxymethylenebutenolidase
MKKDHTPLTDQKFDEHHGHDMKQKEVKEVATWTVSTIDLLKPTTLIPLATGKVEYMSGIQWYLAQPVSGDTLPGVVIIHERWGLNTHIQEMAEVIAMQWYRVLAVDLYNEKVATDMDQAKALSSALDQTGTTANLLAAEQYLRKSSSKVASRGRCLGGKQSLELSMNSPTLDATIVYYGRLPTDTSRIKNIKNPLLGIFAELDGGIPPASVNNFEATLKTLWKTNYDITIYTGASHAFANPTGKAFTKDATLDAWKKTLIFLETTLK